MQPNAIKNFREKIFIRDNIVDFNRNYIPYWGKGGNQPVDHGHEDRPDYGLEEQTYIIDGSGILLIDNADTYTHGWMVIENNEACANGIHGVEIFKTDRVLVVNNKMLDNGQVRY